MRAGIALLLGGALAAPAAPSLSLGRVELFSGLHAEDYSTLDGGPSTFSGGQFDVLLGDPGGWGGQIDAMAGRFSSSELAVAAGVQAWRRSPAGLVGIGFVHTELEDGIRSEQWRIDAEVYEDDLVDAILGAGWEARSFGDDRGFAELFLRFHPGSRLDLVAGFSYAPSDIKQTRADILARADCDLARWRGRTLSVHAEIGGNLFTKASTGLVLRFDGLPSRESGRTRDRRLFRFR